MKKLTKALAMFLGISAIALTLIIIAECFFDAGQNDSAIVYEER